MNGLNSRKIIFFFLLLMSTAGAAFAIDPEENGGVISGKVTTADGKPAGDVTVIIEAINKSALTDDDGNFSFKHLPQGAYTLDISFTGFETISQTVNVDKNKTVSISIQLTVNAKQLQEVVITQAKNKFAKKASAYVAKIPLKNMENPQVYTTLSKELLTDQMVFSVDDAMKNAPGIQTMWQATGRSGDGGGYYNSRGFIVQSQLRNGIAGNVSARIDAANLESIEVIKGPSATLFGSTLTSYGGLINRVTKKPYEKFGGELSYSAGSYGFNRISADVNTPLDSAKKMALRINTAYNYKGSFQDDGFTKGFVFAPSLSYKVNGRLSFLIDAEIYQGRNIVAPIFFFPYGQTIAALGVSRADQLTLDYKRSFISGDVSQQSRNMNYFGQMNYKLSDTWTSQTNITVTNSYSDGPGPYFYLLANSAVTGNSADIGSDYISRNDQFTSNSSEKMLEVQQNFNGEFKIGGMKNRFVGGLDFFNVHSDQFFSGGTLDTIASHGNIPTYRNFNPASLNALYASKGVAFVYPINYISSTYSAYVSDVLNLTDNLLVLAALRADHFVNKGNYDVTTGLTSGGFDQTALSPKFGIVFQPVKNKVSLFGNYQNGFTNLNGSGAGNTEGTGALKPFKPEQANQLEAGVKLDMFEGKLSSTISYYNIKVNDIVRPTATPNVSVQDGTQLSKGIEAEVIANPLPGLNIIAGFAYNDSKYEKADADVSGRRPGTAMSPYVANFWASYRLPKGVIKGLGIGFGGNYASDNKVINSVSQGVFILPAYTILNATVFYDCSSFRFSVKMDNITNKKYWIGYTTVNPQELRSFAGSIAFKF